MADQMGSKPLAPTVDLSGQHGDGLKAENLWESRCVYILGKEKCISVIKRKQAERRLEREPDPNGWRTEIEGEWEQQIALSWWGGKKECNGHHLPSLYRPVTLAADTGLRRLPSMAAPSHVTYLTWQQIQQRSARDFWKQALCRLRAMFICNQTKVNGRILPCNTTKQGFYHSHPQGLWTPYPHTIWRPSVQMSPLQYHMLHPAIIQYDCRAKDPLSFDFSKAHAPPHIYKVTYLQRGKKLWYPLKHLKTDLLLLPKQNMSSSAGSVSAVVCSVVRSSRVLASIPNRLQKHCGFDRCCQNCL